MSISQQSQQRPRLLAVGDIHGCRDELVRLLDVLDLSPEDKLVFLGDYVDRGPDSKGVVDRLIELQATTRSKVVLLKGNHEDMFLGYLGEGGHHGDAFLVNGGRATLASYGLASPEDAREAREVIPEAHVEFLRQLTLWEREPPFLFVHAGIAPLRPLEKQEEEDLLWIREEFIRNRHLLPYTVVFGHTPQREVLWHLPFKIGLDTGCVYGNKLSCMDFTSATLYQVERGGTRVTTQRIAKELQGSFRGA